MKRIKQFISDLALSTKKAFSVKKNVVIIGLALTISIINLFGVFKVSALLITAYLVYTILDRSKEQ